MGAVSAHTLILYNYLYRQIPNSRSQRLHLPLISSNDALVAHIPSLFSLYCMHFIMTLPSRRGALHVLALIATDDTERTKLAYDNHTHHTAADIRIHRLCNPDSSPVMHNLSNLHLNSKLVSCPTDPNSILKHVIPSHTPAEESISSASASSSSSSSSSSPPSSLARMTRSSSRKKPRSHGSPNDIELSAKKKLSDKRKLMIDKAKKISSLDNSPANDRQLHVLRMVYEEITMYPSEAWMAILAMVIRR